MSNPSSHKCKHLVCEVHFPPSLDKSSESKVQYTQNRIWEGKIHDEPDAVAGGYRRRINPQEETAIYEAWKRFALGQIPKGEAFLPPCRTPSEAGVEWKHISINDAVADEGLMILSQLERCHAAMSVPGNTMLNMRPNYGVGIIASMFGAKKFIMHSVFRRT